MGTKSLACLIGILSAAQPCLHPQKGGRESLPLLISEFQSTRDLEAKERILNEITTNFPGSGSALLHLA